MKRVTQATLERMLRDVIRAADLPEAHGKDENGHYRSNPGGLNLGNAYGGYQLEMMVTYGGGIRPLLSGATGKEMAAFLEGLAAGLHIITLAERAKVEAEEQLVHEEKRRQNWIKEHGE